MNPHPSETIREAVRKRYSTIAQMPSCGCGPAKGCCGPANTPAAHITSALGYADSDLAAVPEGANMGLGCGNPEALASLKAGETVLDLGSGGGLDCFLAARRVGPSGKVIGVDMTLEMVRKAQENAAKFGADTVEFRQGEIEHLPVADASVDVILSNCVINLSPDKLQVYREAFRVLRPGGRLAISDIVAIAPLPESLRNDLTMVSSCIGGAETIERVAHMLEQAGFEKIRIETRPGSHEIIREWGYEKKIEDYIRSASIQAVKPPCKNI